MVKDDKSYANFNFIRGHNASALGEHEEALLYFNRTATIYYRDPPEDYRLLSYLHRSRGNAYYRQRQYQNAVDQHQLSKAIHSQQRDSLNLALDHTNIGVAFFKLKKYDKARENFSTALSYRFNANDGASEDISNDYINLADTYLAQGVIEAAQAYADSAFQIEKEILPEHHPQLVYTYLTQARIHQAKNQPDSALTWANRSLTANHTNYEPENTALPDLTSYLKYDYFFEALLLKGRLFAAQNQATNALAYFDHAGGLLDQVSRELTSREDKITLANFNTRLAEAAVALAHEKWRLGNSPAWAEVAFRFAERTKAGVLRNAISGKAARSRAGIPDSLIRLEDELNASIGFHKRELVAGADSAAAVVHQQAVFNDTRRLKELQARYVKDYPRYAQLRAAETSPTLAAVRSVLADDEIVRSYFTGEENIYVFTLTKEDFDLQSVSRPKRLARDVSGLVKGITKRLDRAYLRKGRSLHQLLFPGGPLPEGKRLTLLPDGPLQRIPFEALLTDDSPKGTDFPKLPYLLRRHEVSYAVSTTLLYNSRLAPAAAAPAEPVEVPVKNTTDLLAFAPVFGEGGANAGAERSLGAETLLTALPATATELQDLSAVFQQQDLRAITHIGPEATEQTLRAGDLTTARFLHFATHGFVNEDYPDLSGLALYPDSTSTNDDFLSVGEVYNLSLNAKLVTLSACETGLGKVAGGEGVLGFSRAFLYAGADNLLVSLWQVQDVATATLMVDFYRRTLNDQQAGFANPLRAAKLALLRDERTSHPYYWSPFVLIGE